MSRLIDAKEKLVNLADSGMPKAYRRILMAGFRRIDELERLLHDLLDGCAGCRDRARAALAQGNGE